MKSKNKSNKKRRSNMKATITPKEKPAVVEAERRASQPIPQRPRWAPALWIAPLAWLKLRLFLHAGPTEVGFFGVSTEDDLLYIQDLAVPKQTVSGASVSFDDESVADHFETCVEAGIPPARCGRVWIHTHPGRSPNPSTVDEETFDRVFSSCDWAVMAIVARGGASYCRLSFATGPGGSSEIPILVDWERLPEELLQREGKLDELISGWMDEYGRNVHPEEFSQAQGMEKRVSHPIPARSFGMFDPQDELDELNERQMMEESIAHFDAEEAYQ
jgi:hypothetical protein